MSYEHGGLKIATESNFLSSMDILHPEIDMSLTERYGSESLVGLLYDVGASKVTINQDFSHFEADRKMPKILATATAAGGAGQAATFTLDASAMLTVGLNKSPYLASNTATSKGVPVRVHDTLMIPAQSGTNKFSTLIYAYVNAVDAAAGTFTAVPFDVTITIPAIATAAEIVIFGNAFGEGSKDNESMSTTVSKYTNNTQIIRDTFEITGTAASEKMWFKVNGGWYWTYKGERDLAIRFNNYKELTLLTGKKLTNPAVSDGNVAADPIEGYGAVKTTEGLISQVVSLGNSVNYAAGTGMQITDFEALAKALDKQKGAKQNMVLVGMDLSLQIDKMIRTDFNNGALVFGDYKFSESQKVNLQFDTIKVGNYVFSKKNFDVFNDLQTLGAEGFNFSLEGLVLPMDSRVDAKSGERIQSCRVRYLAQEGVDSRHTKKAVIDNFKLQDGRDTSAVRYLSEAGLECFALNRFGYISLT